MNTPRARFILLLLFWPLTALVLWLDGTDQNAQWLSNILAPLFLFALMSQLKPRQQLVVAIFVPLSAIGEGLFSLVFGLYHYRLGGVPLYVPFGHSILLAMGLLLSQTDLVLKRETLVTRGLALFHTLLIGGVFLLFQDALSLFWGLIFVYFWRRTGAGTVFLIIGVLVLYIEILGTGWGCWRWDLFAWNLIPTINPPVGAFAMYILGDLFALKCARALTPGLMKWRDARKPGKTSA